MGLKVVYTNAFRSLGITESKKVAVVVFTDVKHADVVIYDVEGVEDVAVDERVHQMVTSLLLGTNFRAKLLNKVGNVYFYEHCAK